MLTQLQIQNALPRDRIYRMTDGLGLQVAVYPNGSKLFQVRYRFDGKQRIASLGRFGELGLKEARQRRDEIRLRIRQGVDPVVARREQRERRRQALKSTFSAVAERWLTAWRVSKSSRHADYVERRLQADVFPVIGSLPIEEIRATDIVQVMQRVAQRGALDMAKRTYQMTGQVFRYAIAHGLIDRNPVPDIRPSDVLSSRKVKNYARVSAKELPRLLQAIEGYQGSSLTRLAMKLLCFTFVRTSELIQARWAEFDFEARQWRIPACRMKMREEHIVPLSDQALIVLAALRTISGESDLVFPSERSRGKSMSNNTILKALERMGFKGRMTGHGFRGVASTWLHESGYETLHIEAQLAHRPRNSIRAAYNWASYLPQRKRLMQDWGDFIEQSQRPNLLSFQQKAA